MDLSPCRTLSGLAVLFCLLVACSPPPEAAPAAIAGPARADAAEPAQASTVQPGAADGASLVGEWSPDKDLCSDSRMTFTADGRHEAIMDDGDGWQVLASGHYQQDGRQLRIEFEGEQQVREIVSVDQDGLVLRHDDEALAAVTGGYEVILHRCLARPAAPPA